MLDYCKRLQYFKENSQCGPLGIDFILYKNASKPTTVWKIELKTSGKMVNKKKYKECG